MGAPLPIHIPPASTTGIKKGSKIYMAFLNLFAAFSTTSDK
jgi:hypothetical protein